MVAPMLAPLTLKGYFLPWKVSVPWPPPTPTTNPALVNTTLTVPVSARVGGREDCRRHQSEQGYQHHSSAISSHHLLPGPLSLTTVVPMVVVCGHRRAATIASGATELLGQHLV
jgi:hypothetical protein